MFNKNCKKCLIDGGFEICHESINDFVLIKDDNEFSNSYICPSYYELTENNICKKTGNWVEAEYNIQFKEEDIPDYPSLVVKYFLYFQILLQIQFLYKFFHKLLERITQ